MTNATHPIWRDGDRLVSNACGGFWDKVPDERLETYASDEGLAPLDRAFAAAVLAIRRFERLAATDPSLRHHIPA